MDKTRSLTCCVCGAEAGRWAQHWNQDTGHGICRKCVDWVMTRKVFGRPDPAATPLEFCRTYGIPGVHYQPIMYRHMGLDFAIVAEYPDTDEGMAQANEFMEACRTTGLLAVDAGRIIIAALNDRGAKP